MKLNLLNARCRRTGCFIIFLALPTLFASGVLCCPQVLAQTPLPLQDTTKSNQLREVRVHASRPDIRVASPTPVQILKGAELEHLNSFSVADALRYFTGAELKDYGGIGGLKTVDVRSLGTNHTGIFYDGLPISNAQNGQVDLGKFSLDNIEAIELYNGQKSAIFQPAQDFSVASALYLQSKQPHFTGDEHTHVKASIKSGSFGLFNPAVLWQQKLSTRTASTVSAEWIHADGRYKFRETNGTYDTTAVRHNADISAIRAEAGLNGTLADSSTWSVKAYLYHSDRGLPGAIVKNRFDYDERQWDSNYFVQSTYQTNSGRFYNLLLNAKYALDDTRYLNPYYANLQGYLDNHYQQQNAYLSAANLFHVLPQLDIDFSGDLQWSQLRKLDNDLYHFVYPTRYTALTAFSTDYHLPSFKLQGTLLGTFIDEKVKLYEGAANRQVLSPSLSAIWQPIASDFAVRAFYKHIFRMPTFNDLYYTLIGNTSLKPEYTTQYDAGFTYNKTIHSGTLQQLLITADAYYNRVKDKIVAIPTTNLFRWTMLNLGLVDIRGLDVSIKSGWQLWANTLLRTGINYTYQRALDVTPPPDNSPYQGQIPYVPKHSGSAVLGLDEQQFSFNYSFVYTGSRYNAKDNLPVNYVQPWYTHDISGTYSYQYHKNAIRLTAEVNNLLNQYYDVVLNYPMPGRSYRLTLSINY